MTGTEHELVLLLCQTAAVRERLSERIEQLAREADPGKLAVNLNDQGLLVLCGRRLIDAAGEAVPEVLRDHVERAEAVGAYRSMLHEAATVALLRDLEDAGIPALPLKGVLLSRRLYGDPGVRSSVDVDVLVRKLDFRRAGEVVARRGYATAGDVAFEGDLPNLHESFVATSADLPEIELHWRIHWYEPGTFSERMIERSAPGPDGVRVPSPADDLAALLLFLERDSFLGLKLVADVATWWEAHGAELEDGALEPLAREHPELRDALAAAAAVVERLVGVPATRLVLPPRRPRRTDWAVRLGDWTYGSMSEQEIANLSLIDWLLTPPGGGRAYVRRYLLQPPRTFARTYGLPEEPRVRDHLRRGAHGASRTAKACARLGLALWRIRGGGAWSPLPASLAARQKDERPSVVRTCPATSSAPSASPSKPTSALPESRPPMATNGDRA